MSWLNGYKGKIAADVPLADATWFRLGGPARWMASPAGSDELGDLVRRAGECSIKLKVLGQGANVLVRDQGFDGVVVRLDAPAFGQLNIVKERVIAGAGYDLMRLARICSDNGLSGLEGMAGIPGSVGGAVRMNAGGRWGHFGEVVQRIQLIDHHGTPRELGPDAIQFGYRTSNIGGGIVVSAVINLTRDDPKKTGRRFRELWARKKDTQPLKDRSAGCAFKNPTDKSAGQLIDGCGLKGSSRGGASVSERHANFIVTQPGATASDVLSLIDHIQQVVGDRTGIDLELEIDIW